MEHSAAGDGKERSWLPYAALVLACIYCHGFILTNDSPIWDGWYWLEWLRTKDWAPMRDYTSAQGLPFHFWLYAAFAYTPNIVVTGMWVNFLCLLFESFLIYWLALRLVALPVGEALSIALLAQAIPLVSAAQDFPFIGLIGFRMLFFLSMVFATLAIKCEGARHWILRGLALLGFYVSCVTNGALIVFYGAAWLLFLFYYRRHEGLSIRQAIPQFLRRYPDLFVVPPVVFVSRTLLIQQFGWYVDYNKPGANLPFLPEAFWSFFENVIPFHVQATGNWFVENPVATVVLWGALILWWLKAPRRWSLRRGPFSTAQYLGFGVVALIFAILPLAAGGKFFEPEPVGEPSRHCMFAGIPAAILIFGAVRGIVFLSTTARSVILPALVGSMVLVFGSQYWRIYLAERIESIYSQSALRNISREDELRRSSIILVGGKVSAFKQRLYGTTVLAGLFGDKTRLVSQVGPRHPIGYLPADTELNSLCTTMIPNEFNRIDPGGQQTMIEVIRTRRSLSDAGLALHDLQTRWFAPSDVRDHFLAPLTEIKVKVLRRAVSLVPAKPPGEVPGETVPASVVNSMGMPFVQIPSGMWVAKYETTQSQFETLMGHNPSLFKDPWRPIECVTWDDAIEFCRRLNEREAASLPAGYTYRLPTGAEFDQYVGDAWSRPAVMVGERVTWRTEGIGTRPANQFGLHDTVGNVWEWCLDWWEEKKKHKISKGGAFSSEPANLEPDAWKYADASIIDARRLFWFFATVNDRLLGRVRRDYPNQGYWNRGFRVVLAGPPPAALKPARLRER